MVITTQFLALTTGVDTTQKVGLETVLTETGDPCVEGT